MTRRAARAFLSTFTSAMSEVKITIASDGTPSPTNVQLSVGDTLYVQADGTDAVFCVHPPAFFGGERHEIPAGQTAALTVQPGASGSFDFIVVAGDLDAPCGGGRDKAMAGGGGVG